MGEKPFEPAARKLVLVEGIEEARLTKPLLRHLHLSGIEVQPYQGKQKLRAYPKGLRAASGFRNVTSLGIVRDADDNVASAFRSVSNAVNDAGLTPPRRLGRKGKGHPEVSVLILPDGTRPGMLEDVCLDSVSDKPVMGCIENLFECVEQIGDPLPAANRISKAKVYAYLATRVNPGRRIGEEAESDGWPFDSPAFEPICSFLKSL